MSARKSPSYDPTKWPACWVLSLIAADRLHDFYISGPWKRVRADVLKKQHGECQDCAARGLAGVTATIVHHERPLRQRPDLALSPTDERGNRQLTALCDSCHWHRHHRKAAMLTEERW